MTIIGPVRRFLLLAGLATLGLAVLAAGCGEDDSTAAWADGACSSITTWADDVRGSVNSLAESNLSRETLESTLTDVEDSTETLKSDLEGLGRPETASGQEASDALDTLSTQLTTGVQDIRSAFEGASGVSELLTAAGTATATIEEMANQVRSTVTTLEGLEPGDELRTAFEDSDDCADLQEQLDQLSQAGS
jgi:uncharacterized phage infection (PIP) family protein YhgE